MQHTSKLNWRDREVVQLQDEVALLIRLLGAIKLLGTGPQDHPGRREGPPPASRPTPIASHAMGDAHGPALSLQGRKAARGSSAAR